MVDLISVIPVQEVLQSDLHVVLFDDIGDKKLFSLDFVLHSSEENSESNPVEGKITSNSVEESSDSNSVEGKADHNSVKDTVEGNLNSDEKNSDCVKGKSDPDSVKGKADPDSVKGKADPDSVKGKADPDSVTGKADPVDRTIDANTSVRNEVSDDNSLEKDARRTDSTPCRRSRRASKIVDYSKVVNIWDEHIEESPKKKLETPKRKDISKAANSLAMSQSAASSALSEMESQFDIQLFDRVGKRLQLSELGRQLRPRAESLLAQARAFEEDPAGYARRRAELVGGDLLAACRPACRDRRSSATGADDQPADLLVRDGRICGGCIGSRRTAMGARSLGRRLCLRFVHDESNGA